MERYFCLKCKVTFEVLNAHRGITCPVCKGVNTISYFEWVTMSQEKRNSILNSGKSIVKGESETQNGGDSEIVSMNSSEVIDTFFTMETPEVYFSQQDENIRRHTKKMENERDSRISQINSMSGDQCPVEKEHWGVVGAVLSVVMAFFAAFDMLLPAGGGDLVPWLFWVGIVLGVLGALISNGHFERDIMEYKTREKDRAERQYNNGIQQYKDKIEKDKREYKEKYELYLKQSDAAFVQSTSDLATKYAGSPITDEIVDYLMPAIEKKIEIQDRSQTKSVITSENTLKIYADRIEFQDEKYMKEHNCNTAYVFFDNNVSDISEISERVALAKVIGSKIQFNLMTKYPKDISGGDVNITFEVSDFHDYKDNGEGKDFCTVVTKYFANNGNYKVMREW